MSGRHQDKESSTEEAGIDGVCSGSKSSHNDGAQNRTSEVEGMPAILLKCSDELYERCDYRNVRGQQAQAKAKSGHDKGCKDPCRCDKRPMRRALPQQIDRNHSPQEEERGACCSCWEHGVESLHTR